MFHRVFKPEVHYKTSKITHEPYLNLFPSPLSSQSVHHSYGKPISRGKSCRKCKQSPVLITPPCIPTGFLLDFNFFSKKAFLHIFTFPSYWTPTEPKQISQTECNGSDTGFLLGPTGVLYNLSLLTPNQLT